MRIKTKKHLTKKWEVSITEVHDGEIKKYKVTKRLPELSISETRILDSKEEAIKLFNEWLN